MNEEWRFCIDFGTAATKVCISRRPALPLSSPPEIYPLRLGEIFDGTDRYLVPTSILFHKDRIRLGIPALKDADPGEAAIERLSSFKEVLGAKDVRAALNLRLRKSIDANGAFTYRDALILYLAFVLVLSDCAIKLHTQLKFDVYRSAGRFTYPQWRSSAVTCEILRQLFNEASRVAELVGEFLISVRGIDFRRARQALESARQSPNDSMIVTGIFEARAAAEAHLIADDLPQHLLVLDMGAGTTDLTAFHKSGPLFEEIRSVRRSLPVACDELDRSILALFLERAARNHTLSRQQQLQLWRRLSRRTRELKEALFRTGSCATVLEGKRIVLKAAELEKDAHFRDTLQLFAGALTAALEETSEAINRDRRSEIGVILAGGGSFLPPIQKMVRRARPRSERIQLLPLVPRWASQEMFGGTLAPVFPQMAICIGGSLMQVSESTAIITPAAATTM